MAARRVQQEPMAIVGFSCRLPGASSSPSKLWDMLERGDIASNDVPASRFQVSGHYDGSKKPGTMRPSGGFFLEDVHPADFDASFFAIGNTEATAMDPNQRQMLEVVFEGLENSGLTLDQLSGAPVGCFVGSFASDYGEIQSRDPEDRPPNTVIGVGRSILANRLSHYLNLKGPSVTLDTACSGSLVGLDFACQSLQSGEINAAIIAASNLFLNPDHVMDVGSVGQAYSPTARCHTFDIRSDGYAKAEAVTCLIVKRLSDAIEHCDPVRAVIRGTSSNSNGRTTGIASPSAEAQAAAIRAAYANAGLKSFDETTYLECHGTGTPVGDPTEVNGAGSVFAKTRDPQKPLHIGSIKSNIGHAEPAAGSCGLMKVIMSMEKGMLPGTPSFVTPNPNIDFVGNKVKVSRTLSEWPAYGCSVRRASVNSFGYGGSNAHAIVELPQAELRRHYVYSRNSRDFGQWTMDRELDIPLVCVLSANDAVALKASIKKLSAYLINPGVQVSLKDLAYTLSERRSHLYHRAFISSKSTDIEEKDFVIGHVSSDKVPRIAFIFTGQGAQWPQMGAALVKSFPWTRELLEEMDMVLQAKPDAPGWSLVTEITEPRSAEHLRRPELSQSLVTALQICLVSVFRRWGIQPESVVGHSSGEIAAAYSAGLIDLPSAITAAFERGRAAARCNDGSTTAKGMLAVGLGPTETLPFLEKYSGSIHIACFNSPKSVTISGETSVLNEISDDLKAAGHFARPLLVDLAYHSPYMTAIAEQYHQLLSDDIRFSNPAKETSIKMYSSVTASKISSPVDSLYWKTNMLAPVRFHAALKELLSHQTPDILIEIGPANALSGPIAQILKELPDQMQAKYVPSWSRGKDPVPTLLNVAGNLFTVGAKIDMKVVNGYDLENVRTIVDLPNYSWNHSTKYWHESAASKDWRFKDFVSHETLGSKIPGTPWSVAPTWRRHLMLAEVPWLRDHDMGGDIVLPGAGHTALALEAMYQTHRMLHPSVDVTSANDLSYHFRDVKFKRALVVEEQKRTTQTVSLSRAWGSDSNDWYQFRVMTHEDGLAHEHSTGLIRVCEPVDEPINDTDARPLELPQPSAPWYKAQDEVGVHFGPTFQKLKQIEVVNGARNNRATLSLEPPPGPFKPMSYYPLHPVMFDTCFQVATPSIAGGDRTNIKHCMLPSTIDNMIVNKMRKTIPEGLATGKATYTGLGPQELARSWAAHVRVYDPETKDLIMKVDGLQYVQLNTELVKDLHVLHAPIWKPDISLLSEEQLSKLLLPIKTKEEQVDAVLDMLAFRKPFLKVLEVNLDPADSSCLWLSKSPNTIRAACRQYDFTSPDSTVVVQAQEQQESSRNAQFHLLRSMQHANSTLVAREPFDVAIVKGIDSEVQRSLRSIEKLLAEDAFVLRCPTDAPGASALILSKQRTCITVCSHGSAQMNRIMPEGQQNGYSLDSAIDSSSKSVQNHHVYFSNSTSNLNHKPRTYIVNFDEHSPIFAEVLSRTMMNCGIFFNRKEADDLARLTDDDKTPVLVAEELSRPLLTRISPLQWNVLQKLVCSGRPILWLTQGAQMSSTNPNASLAVGLFRTVRAERPDVRLTVLDVESATSAPSAVAVCILLEQMIHGAAMETEYAERCGMIYIQRIMADSSLNAHHANTSGAMVEPVVTRLSDTEKEFRLRAGKTGTLEGLQWYEVDDVPGTLKPGTVEIEIIACGVNFKDVATIMGLVPANERLLGCECAGYVRRVANDVTRLAVGTRVAAQINGGTFSNRIRCGVDRVHPIPDSLSFEDAATMPLVYITALYGLYDLANLSEGQTVLIHSAAGGVGIAAIQLALHRKATHTDEYIHIFATVGTNEKRKYLHETFGIPNQCILNSRTADFAREIRQRTNGRGVDVVLNSLTGNLLDESWRLLAGGGTMVEIGKADIIGRGVLSMEPFDRNCSFRAVDLSRVLYITDQLIGRLLGRVFQLFNGGHIKPIRPVRVFKFEEIVQALAHMRRGEHIGKIVVSREEDPNVKLPVRLSLPQLQLRPNASYLIVGGLKGLCGSVAVHLARNGARHLIVMNRSGLGDATSARIVQDCAAYECRVQEAKGDVTNVAFVRHAFQNAEKPIAGIIQGAMVLRDRPYEIMSPKEFHAVTAAKVKGTWALHEAAEQTPLDFFTMLSSLSGIVGNKGQANYAAANSFLDAFAHYRQALGLRAHSIDLGAIEDVGYVENHALEMDISAQQWMPINEKTLRQLVGYSIIQQADLGALSTVSCKQLITGIASPLSTESALSKDLRFAYLFYASSDGIGDAAAKSNTGTEREVKALQMLVATGVDADAAKAALLELLQGQIKRMLRTETEPEPGKPLAAYGLDSLLAVELRSWVREKFAVDLTTLDITNASSLVILSRKIIERMEKRNS